MELEIGIYNEDVNRRTGKMNENKYYKVVTKCGHVGRRFYVPVQFAIIAESGKEAARIARELPRVKHQHKDAILQVKEISYEEFQAINEVNKNDPYLQCHSKQEQNALCDMASRIVEDPHFTKPIKHDKKERRERIEFKQRKFKSMMSSNRMEGLYEYAY